MEEELMEEELSLYDMYRMDKEATKKLFEQIKGAAKVELLDYAQGIRFEHDGHTFVFTAELED